MFGIESGQVGIQNIFFGMDGWSKDILLHAVTCVMSSLPEMVGHEIHLTKFSPVCLFMIIILVGFV